MEERKFDENPDGVFKTSEIRRVAGLLGLSGNEIVAEIGCGTPEFSVRLAELSALVYAVDESEERLSSGRRKALRRGTTNIRFERAGLLSWSRTEGSLDAVVAAASQVRGLSDPRRTAGLRRLWRLLRPEGRLLLREAAGRDGSDNALAAGEFEETLKLSGFTLERRWKDGPVLSYLCSKEPGRG
jgi:ubiquinone/menaquinone biosynthesis C-methylase UbiE